LPTGSREERHVSYPYPQDRNRDRKEKGEQPYKDAKETLSRADAELQREAEAYGETRRDEEEGERRARQETEAEDRLRRVGEEVAGLAHQEAAEGGARTGD
jgi:hypothetical protein